MAYFKDVMSEFVGNILKRQLWNAKRFWTE